MRSKPEARSASLAGVLAWTSILSVACIDLSPSLIVGSQASDAGPQVRPFPVPDASLSDASDSIDSTYGQAALPGSVDLVLVRVEDRPDSLRPGQPYTLVLIIENLGRSASPSTFARAELVPTGRLEGRAPIETGGAFVPPLSSGDAKDIVLSGQVRQAIAPGRYRLRITVDPEDRIEEFLESNNTVDAGALDVSYLSVSPTTLDFGVVAPNCAATESIRVENFGADPVFVSKVEIAPSSVFQLNPISLPLGLDPSASADIRVRFTPRTPGPALSELTLEHEQFIGPQEILVVGRSAPNPVREDVFYQRPGPQLDVVFVIQDGCATPSCEIAEEQAQLSAGFRLFRDQAGALKADFRVFVTTTDPSPSRLGRLRGPPLTKATPSLDLAFRSQILAGSSGSTQPAGLAAAAEVIESGVLRPETGIVVIFLALDDDRSGQSPDDWVRRMRSTIGPRGTDRLVISGVIAPEGRCPRPTPRYERAIDLTLGWASEICDLDDYEALFRLGGPELGLAYRFSLERAPSAVETISVEVNGAVLSQFDQETGRLRWIYDPDRQAIIFSAGSVPPEDARIVVRYRSVC